MKTGKLIALFLLLASGLSAQQTVGLFTSDSLSYEGYTLFAPTGAKETYLIDNCGRQVNQWTSTYNPGLSAYFLEDGTMLRACRVPTGTGGAGGGVIERRAWDNTLIWTFTYLGVDYRQHHDIRMLPNGNVLLLAREEKTEADCIAAGRDTALVGPNGLIFEYLVEVQPILPDSGVIVWEWHYWDHLIQDYDSTKANYGVVADHPELLDMNSSVTDNADWLHCNSVAYNEALDQIIINSRNQNEFYILDHSTTTAEAASHTGGARGKGGDFLYRWGCPSNYDRGTAADQKLWVQHDAHWIEPGLNGAGNILIFNNGEGRPGPDFSTVLEIVPPMDVNGDYTLSPGQAWGPAAPVWSYQAPVPTDFFANRISGSQRLPNGNTLICEGPEGRIFEVDDAGTIHWEYVVPLSSGVPITQGNAATFNASFRAYRYGTDYPGFTGITLTPGDQIEVNPLPLPAECLPASASEIHAGSISAWPNPSTGDFYLSAGEPADWKLFSPQGILLSAGKASAGRNILSFDFLPAGVYLLRVEDTHGSRLIHISICD